MTIALERDHGADRISPRISVEERAVGANVTCLTVQDARALAGLGDGRVVAIDWTAKTTETVARHDGAVTAIAPGQGGEILSAGQDGRLLADGAEIYRSGGWLGPMSHRGVVAVAAGRDVLVFDGGSERARLTGHPSTVSDLALSPDGLRVAVSHYDGLSLWSLTEPGLPDRLFWKGSMTKVSWSLDGRYLAGATQDRELHIWDLVTGRDYRLGGFQAKVRQIGWTDDSSHLISSGSEVIAAWPLAGDPGAFPPKEIGYVSNGLVTAVAGSAPLDGIAGGYSNGAILVGDCRTGTALIARAGDECGPVTALAPVDQRPFVCFGTRGGQIGRIQRAAAT